MLIRLPAELLAFVLPELSLKDILSLEQASNLIYFKDYTDTNFCYRHARIYATF